MVSKHTWPRRDDCKRSLSTQVHIASAEQGTASTKPGQKTSTPAYLGKGAEVEGVEDGVDAVALVVGLQLLKDVHRFLVELAHVRRPHQNLV